MRPQHITAENLVTGAADMGRWVSFNEAAAYHCGKPSWMDEAVRELIRASMRPQHITAENLTH